MSFLNNLKPNKPTASLEGYFIAMLAKSKYGKTTFAVDLAKEFYGNLDKTLMLATEIGFKALADVYAIPVVTFDKVKPKKDGEETEEKGFIQVVDELIKNKANIPFRFIIIDTITALERYAIQHVLRKKSIEDGERYSDISDIKWGKGYNLVAEAVYSQIDRLKKAGYGVFVIGHEKTRKTKTKEDFEFDYTTFNVLTKTSDIIEREADMIIYGDMQVVKGKNDRAVTKRLLKFRSDGNILCGTRFRNFPDEIESDVTVFLDEFKKAVLSLYGGDEKAVEQAKKEQEVEREEKSDNYLEQELTGKSPADLIAEITATIKDLDNKDKKKLVPIYEATLGMKNYNNATDVEALEEALADTKAFVQTLEASEESGE